MRFLLLVAILVYAQAYSAEAIRQGSSGLWMFFIHEEKGEYRAKFTSPAFQVKNGAAVVESTVVIDCSKNNKEKSIYFVDPISEKIAGEKFIITYSRHDAPMQHHAEIENYNDSFSYFVNSEGSDHFISLLLSAAESEGRLDVEFIYQSKSESPARRVETVLLTKGLLLALEEAC